MLRTLRRSQMDLVLKRGDRLRALTGQVALRYYPSGSRRSVTPRVFYPQHVIREPGAGAPDQIEEDRQFALKLSGDIWEHWQRIGEREWRMLLVDKTGVALDHQPLEFGDDGISPYGDQLPVQLIYDELPAGRAWLAPRCSRTAWQEAINGPRK